MWRRPLTPLVLASAVTRLKAPLLVALPDPDTTLTEPPVAIAVFPQEMKISVSDLEPEFQNKKGKDGRPIEYVVCNKGL